LLEEVLVKVASAHGRREALAIHLAGVRRVLHHLLIVLKRALKGIALRKFIILPVDELEGSFMDHLGPLDRGGNAGLVGIALKVLPIKVELGSLV